MTAPNEFFAGHNTSREPFEALQAEPRLLGEVVLLVTKIQIAFHRQPSPHA